MNTAYDWDFSLLLRHSDVLLAALLVTFKLMLMVILLAIPFGFLLAIGRMGKTAPTRYLTAGVIEITRSIPPLVWVVWFYYCLPILTGISFSAFTTVVFALSLYTGVFFAELFRAGLQSVDRGAVEAGYAGGMSNLQVLRRITGPIAFLRIVPPTISQCVLTMKQTSLAGFVAIPELLYEGQRLSIHTFRPMEVLTTIALIYTATVIPLTLIATNIEQKIQRKYFRQ